MKNYFSKKKVLIIGASQGIGKALARQMSKLCSDLFIVSRNEVALKSLCDDTQNNNANVSYALCDVSVKSNVTTAVHKACEQMQGIDIAIINAGINGSEGFDDFDSEIFKRIYDVNIHGILHSMESLIPIMKRNNGGIIAGVSSLADIRGFPGSGAYSSSKAAATVILEAAHLELARFNIKVLTIKPGFVDTNMTKKNKFPMPFLISPDKAASYIVKGLTKEKTLIAFPLPTKILSGIGKILPKCIFNFMFSNRNFKF